MISVSKKLLFNGRFYFLMRQILL